MKYTIRNKSKTPILTFTKKSWDAITKNYSPEAYCIAWFALQKEYKNKFFKSISLDYNQMELFNQWVGASEKGYWTASTNKLNATDYAIYNAFLNGFGFMTDFEETIKTAERFLNMLLEASK